jgi:hypothetical protein
MAFIEAVELSLSRCYKSKHPAAVRFWITVVRPLQPWYTMHMPALCRLFLAIAVMSLGGCTWVREQSDYVIVASKKTIGKNPSSGEDQEEIIFTIRYKGVTIKAHCQFFDVNNHCGELRVGESYHFKRDDRYLTVESPDQPAGTVLGIEEENLGK